jgi:voltage-gated potassium channel
VTRGSRSRRWCSGCLALVQVSLISHVLRQREVTFDTIAAAACAYVVFGAIWGDVYFLLALGVPDSFAIPATLLSGAGALRVALAYFSFETLTTIAYGDIHPTTAGAGGLAISEAIVGQLYLAIMITRLVALQLAGRSDPRPAPEE